MIRHHTAVARLVALVVAISFLLTPGTANAQTAEIELYQLDITTESESVPNSGWGLAELTYFGSGDILYFNLSIDGEWVIQNITVLSHRGVGVEQTQSFSFPLGVDDGVDLPVTFSAFELTTLALAVPPAGDTPTLVDDLPYEIFKGSDGPPLTVTEPVAMVGEAVAPADEPDVVNVGPSIVNQECGPLECVPAAVSNALIFLNDTHSLGIDDTLISIGSLKGPLKFKKGGGTRGDWVKRKLAYVEANDIPVTTTRVEPKTPADMQQVINAIKNNCAVEINLKGHTAVVIGVTPKANGRYGLDIAHDTYQSNNPNAPQSGTRIESVTFELSSRKVIDGSALLRNRKVEEFVIECPAT